MGTNDISAFNSLTIPQFNKSEVESSYQITPKSFQGAVYKETPQNNE
jgi:hypothetical protein